MILSLLIAVTTALALVGLPANVEAKADEPQTQCGLSNEQTVRFIDEVNRAENQAQQFYHYFKRGQIPSVSPPEWLSEDLDRMIRNQLWQDPEEGPISEAQGWQALSSAAYEFFERTRGTFPKRFRGAGLPPAALLRDYVDTQRRLSYAVDRLREAQIGTSLGGRGEAVISVFQQMKGEMNRTISSLKRSDCKSYYQGVSTIASLTAQASKILHEPPKAR